MKVVITLLLILTTVAYVDAQERLKTLTFTDSILYSAVDRPGDIYAVTKSGQIQKFDKDGKLAVLYKAPGVPTLFDPRDGARLFVYYRQDQHYEFLSPSFQVTGSYKIDPSFAIQPWLICPSGEYKLWILDKADHSLKKVNVKESVVEVEVVIDSTLIQNVELFKTMREYQGFVFLLDPSQGILIFNSLGKHIRTLDLPGLRGFNFLGEEIYYLRGDSIEFFNLFSAAKGQPLEIGEGVNDVLLTDERLISIGDMKIDILTFRP